MSGTGPPPQGYRWVDGGLEDGAASSRRGRRWWWVGAAALVAVLVLAGAGIWVWRSKPVDGAGGREAAERSAPSNGTPKDLLVSFGLRRQPVAGWQVKNTDLGLPDYAPLGDLFANTGDKAYFLSQFVDLHCAANCRPQAAWVYGVDTRTGARLFDPVPLADFRYAVTCFGNGPGVAVCLKADQPLTAWVIDLDKGKVTYTGPTDLAYSARAGQPEATPIGTRAGQSRLLATVRGQGVHGVGSHAELTWFVPGNGFVAPGDDLVADDLPPPAIALSPSKDGQPDRVFSVVDGKDLTPPAPAGAELSHATVYSDGFAYVYKHPGTHAGGVLFYDVKGKLLADHPFGPAFVTLLNNPAVPIAWSDGAWHVYSAEGKQLSQFPAPEVAPDLRAIGDKLYVNRGDPSQKRWQQWDFLTGQPGATCAGWQLKGTSPAGAGTYVASDGAVLLTETEELSGRFEATDAATCQVLWQTAEDAKLYIWKVGAGLLQTDRGSNIMTWLRPAA